MSESETQLSHTPEPWLDVCWFDTKYGEITLTRTDFNRAVKCVDACADIPNPEEVVPKMIEAVKVLEYVMPLLKSASRAMNSDGARGRVNVSHALKKIKDALASFPEDRRQDV